MAQVTERKLVTLARRLASSRQGGGLLLGVGDDCAVFKPAPGHETLITTDTLVEGVHFHRRFTTAKLLAGKAVAVCVSDVAAMGGAPRLLFLSINFTDDTGWKWMENFMRGFAGMTEKTGAILAGGNVARAPADLSFTVTALGEVKRGLRVNRGGAMPGDLIYVTGTPGDSALGLDLLNSGKKRYADWERKLVKRHNSPTPRLAWGALLSARKIASAMIDVSDGVALDLKRMMEASGASARVGLARFPLSPGAKRVVSRGPAGGWERILGGGEDYELLFTVRPSKIALLDRLAGSGAIECSCIGEVTRGKGALRIYDENGLLTGFGSGGYWHSQE